MDVRFFKDSDSGLARYREFPQRDYLLVITAYDLAGKAKQAYRRRRKRP